MRQQWAGSFLLVLALTVCGRADPPSVLPLVQGARSRPPRCNLPVRSLQNSVDPAGQQEPGDRAGASSTASRFVDEGNEQEINRLMEQVVLASGEPSAADEGSLRGMSDGLLQLRLNRVYPRRVNVAALRAKSRVDAGLQNDAASRESAALHLLRLRVVAEAEWGDQVQVVPYDGGGGVRFAMLWRAEPDHVGPSLRAPDRNVTISRLAFQPLHPAITRPLWTGARCGARV